MNEAAEVEQGHRKLNRIARFRCSGDPVATAAVIAADSADSALTVIFAMSAMLAKGKGCPLIMTLFDEASIISALSRFRGAP